MAPRLAFLIVALLSLSGCKEEISVYRVAKSEAPSAPSPAAPEGLSWKVPEGWSENPATGMRRASFTLQGVPAERADISVTAFPGDAGGLSSNVNRWRGQIGLKPLDDAALAKARADVASPAGKVALFDFTGPGKKRVLGAILSHDGQSWFFKLSGEEKLVASAKPSFLKFLKSLNG